jgi:hypothetical protein
VPYVRRVLSTAAAAGGLAALACVLPAVSLAEPVAPAPCTVSPLSQPFLQWGDQSTYELVAGGDFEGSPADWSLQGGSGVVDGSELFGVTGGVGSSSLQLTQGAVATAPPVCVNIPHPAARMFVRSDSADTQLKVQAVYSDGQHNHTIPAGPMVKVGTDWAPTRPLKIHPVVIPALHGTGTALITLRFTAVKGTSYIDDVFVDPRGRY